MAESVKITFNGIPNLYPPGYTGIINLTNTRPVKIGMFQEDFKTEAKWKTLFNSIYKNQPIQSIAYDRYKIEVVRKESQTFEVLTLANTVTILQVEQGISHNAIIESVESEKIFNSAFSKVTITYYDNNKSNYLNTQPIIDYLKSDILQGIHGSGIDRIEFTTNNATISTFAIYGILSGKLITKDATEVQQDEINGVKKDTRHVNKLAYECVYYLGVDDYQELKTDLQLADPYSIYTDIYHSVYKYRALERPDFTIEEVQGSVDLYKLTVSLVYEINNNSTY